MNIYPGCKSSNFQINMTNHLILALHKHRQLGWRFNLYFVDALKEGVLSIQGPPSAEFMREQAFTKDEQELVRLLNDSSERSLMKKYSRETTVKDFLNKLKPETLEKFVRPAIEIYASRIVPLAKKTGIGIYLRNDLQRTVLYREQKIRIPDEKTRCLFNFIRDDAGLRYFITLTNENLEILLEKKPCIVVAESPAIVLVDNILHTIDDIEAKRIAPFHAKKYIAVPPAMEQKYMQDFVLKMFLRYPVRMTGINVVHAQPEKQALLTLEEDFDRRLYLRSTFMYGTNQALPSSGKKTTAWLDPENSFRICCYERDFAWEQACIDRLTAAGLVLKGDSRLYMPESDDGKTAALVVWLNANQDAVRDFTVLQNTHQKYYMHAVSLLSSCDAKPDWFDVNIVVVAGKYRIPFVRFRKNILSGNREYILPDNSLFILPEEWFARYMDLFQYGEKEDNQIRLKKMHFMLIDRMAVDGKKPAGQSSAPDVGTSGAAIPDSLSGILRPYQKEGFYWLLHLHRNRFGGCLADDMGLGKTLQTIALLQYIYGNAAKRATPADASGQRSLFDLPPAMPDLPASLIVVPTSLMHNWQNEFQRFAPGLKTCLYAGNSRYRTKDIGRIFRHYQAVITSYGTLRNDIEFLHCYAFHYLILDESQYVKNSDSQTYRAAKHVQADHRLALTGTPVENNLLDLWAQFNFINEGLLGNESFFRKTYIQPIVKRESKEMEKRLLRLIRPFILRRTKEEVTPELPPLSQEIIYCDMSDAQQKAYETEKSSLRNGLLAEPDQLLEKNRFIALQGLMRLRLMANHPLLTHPAYEGDSGKYEQIILSFESLRAGGHKVLIFSSFVKHLKLIAREFDRQQWKYAMLTGDTPVRDREKEIARFTDTPDVNCFFISLKAGGVGLNLMAADYVFVIDPWWNPAAELQALSRAHRIGQDRHVIAYRFISSGTIEEKILHLQERKKQLSDMFISSGNPLENLSAEEIRRLFE
jgi:superfamily II DNA or RNA helicase